MRNTVIELLVVTGAYFAVLVLVVYLTGAGRRRVVGAFGRRLLCGGRGTGRDDGGRTE
jgi:hypothetical protein